MGDRQLSVDVKNFDPQGCGRFSSALFDYALNKSTAVKAVTVRGCEADELVAAGAEQSAFECAKDAIAEWLGPDV